jgi:hypothetical protein
MTLNTQIGPEFESFDFTHDRRTYEQARSARSV